MDIGQISDTIFSLFILFWLIQNDIKLRKIKQHLDLGKQQSKDNSKN